MGWDTWLWSWLPRAWSCAPCHPSSPPRCSAAGCGSPRRTACTSTYRRTQQSTLTHSLKTCPTLTLPQPGFRTRGSPARGRHLRPSSPGTQQEHINLTILATRNQKPGQASGMDGRMHHVCIYGMYVCTPAFRMHGTRPSSRYPPP
jgi:hypothetical protein